MELYYLKIIFKKKEFHRLENIKLENTKQCIFFLTKLMVLGKFPIFLRSGT